MNKNGNTRGHHHREQLPAGEGHSGGGMHRVSTDHKLKPSLPLLFARTCSINSPVPLQIAKLPHTQIILIISHTFNRSLYNTSSWLCSKDTCLSF